MTYRTVADQLVTTVSGIAESVLDAEVVRGRFKHNRRIGHGDYVGASRDFNLFGFGGFAGMQHNSRATDEIDLAVDYITNADAFDLDVTIRTDYAQLVKALQDPANWPAACVILPAGEQRFPYSIEDVEDEDGRSARRLIVSFAVEHTALD